MDRRQPSAAPPHGTPRGHGVHPPGGCAGRDPFWAPPASHRAFGARLPGRFAAGKGGGGSRHIWSTGKRGPAGGRSGRRAGRGRDRRSSLSVRVCLRRFPRHSRAAVSRPLSFRKLQAPQEAAWCPPVPPPASLPIVARRPRPGCPPAGAHLTLSPHLPALDNGQSCGGQLTPLARGRAGVRPHLSEGGGGTWDSGHKRHRSWRETARAPPRPRSWVQGLAHSGAPRTALGGLPGWWSRATASPLHSPAEHGAPGLGASGQHTSPGFQPLVPRVRGGGSPAGEQGCGGLPLRDQINRTGGREGEKGRERERERRMEDNKTAHPGGSPPPSLTGAPASPPTGVFLPLSMEEAGLQRSPSLLPAAMVAGDHKENWEAGGGAAG